MQPAPTPRASLRPLFRRVLLLAGVPFGILVGLTTAAAPPRSWPDLVLTAVVSAGGFGGALGGAAVLYLRYVRRSAWTIAALFLLLGAVGVLVGSTVYVGSRWWPHGRWSRLGAPPEPGRSFAGPTCYSDPPWDQPAVYLQTAQGDLYELRSGEGRARSWHAATATAPDTGRVGYGCKNHLPERGRTPFPPGPVAATYQVDLRGADCGGRYHYVLLKDGSVWEWSTGGCAIGEVLFLFAFALVGLALGLVSTLAILALGWAPAWTRRTEVGV